MAVEYASLPMNLSEGEPMATPVELEAMAPDFSLSDFNGQTVRLSDYRGERHVVLVFNRGFF